MVLICGDDYGYIELTPGQSWVIPGITEYIKITHARYIDSTRAYVNIQIGTQEYGLEIYQNRWYTVGNIQFKGDVQIRNKRLNHICVNVPVIEPSLQIDRVLTELSPAGDLPQYNRYGVYLEIHVSGVGKGSLKINWGTDHSETKTGIVAGNYAYVYNLPIGTHNICAELFSVE